MYVPACHWSAWKQSGRDAHESVTGRNQLPPQCRCHNPMIAIMIIRLRREMTNPDARQKMDKSRSRSRWMGSLLEWKMNGSIFRSRSLMYFGIGILKGIHSIENAITHVRYKDRHSSNGSFNKLRFKRQEEVAVRFSKGCLRHCRDR